MLNATRGNNRANLIQSGPRTGPATRKRDSIRSFLFRVNWRRNWYIYIREEPTLLRWNNERVWFIIAITRIRDAILFRMDCFTAYNIMMIFNLSGKLYFKEKGEEGGEIRTKWTTVSRAKRAVTIISLDRVATPFNTVHKRPVLAPPPTILMRRWK